MKVNSDLILRVIAGEHILVPVKNELFDHNGLFVLSEVGARIWELLPDAETEQQIADVLQREYEVDEATLKKDISAFLERLRAMDVME